MVDGWTRIAIMHEGEENGTLDNEIRPAGKRSYTPSPKKPESMRERLARLERELRAQRVVQEGKYHEEKRPGSGVSRGRGSYSWDRDIDYSQPGYNPEEDFHMETVIDEPRITEPDVEKRNSAMAELYSLHGNSK